MVIWAGPFDCGAQQLGFQQWRSEAHACPTESNNNQQGTLRPNAYQNSCPDAEPIVFSGVAKAVADDPRMAASLLRLHFHDCFGCDGSVLLDDSPTFVGEKSAAPNLNSLRGFEVIDAIKSDLESLCPETVSCADILAIAARDSVVLSGGPGWDVQTGRRDSLSASKTVANNNIPGPNSDVATLVSKFQNVGLDLNDMVTLSGAHTIGKARCSTFSSRLNGVSNPVLPGQDMGFLQSLQQLCLQSDQGGNSTQNLAELDLVTPATFDNQYYINLISGEGLLTSDQALVTTNSDARDIVESYAADTMLFFDNFVSSMVRLGGLSPLLGNSGEIRRSCRRAN
ncbi:hypothetical protein Scep_030863 [Stephania cephalantha]|uniref:Peroxidase n=1 Tax=Stephania cephalantha TaxID=152367 RepID=A0AAP0E4Y7_9MAGN